MQPTLVWRIEVGSEEQAEVLASEMAAWGYDSFQTVGPTTEEGITAEQPWILEAYGRQGQIRAGCNEWLMDQFPGWIQGFEEPQVLADINWNKEWESRFEPVRLGRHFGIRAPFHEPLRDVEQELVIMPRMSFGTGHHPTTMMLCWWLLGAPQLEKDFGGPVVTRLWEGPNKSLGSPAGLRVLDMGCGTGILGILAHRLGAQRVWGMDIEEGSAANAAENAKRNGVEGLWEQGDAQTLAASREAKVDLVLANINRNILLEDMPIYVQVLNEGGQLWLSGFYAEDAEVLLERASALGLEPFAQAEMNRWTTLLLVKSAVNN
ncbi:MAG: 50S ribosomal protein L11 methyltransferase [Cytophagia bacterium]|nr:50S ribosomal protein L11 methyltransferase [Cytophagia bacterium]